MNKIQNRPLIQGSLAYRNKKALPAEPKCRPLLSEHTFENAKAYNTAPI